MSLFLIGKRCQKFFFINTITITVTINNEYNIKRQYKRSFLNLAHSKLGKNITKIYR